MHAAVAARKRAYTLVTSRTATPLVRGLHGRRRPRAGYCGRDAAEHLPVGSPRRWRRSMWFLIPRPPVRDEPTELGAPKRQRHWCTLGRIRQGHRPPAADLIPPGVMGTFVFARPPPTG
jgi:hypothetical protein